MGLEKPTEKPKRLRGWQMEKESGRKKVALEKALAGLEKPAESQCGLANLLLHLWSSGTLSATMIRQVAHLAMEAGASHTDLQQLASCGNWGKQPGNIHRQVMNKFCPQVMLPEPFHVKVECIDPKTSLEKEDWAAVFLPHLQFAHLGEHYPEFFEKAFCCAKGSLERFRTGVQKVKDDRLVGHPMCLEKHTWKKRVVPLMLHADGVEFHNRDSLMVWSWGCMLAEMSSLKQHMLLAAFPKSCTTPETWKPIWKWLK